jgi:hypothetical protein
MPEPRTVAIRARATASLEKARLPRTRSEVIKVEAGMQRVVERPGALDVHKATVTACVRVWEGRVLSE